MTPKELRNAAKCYLSYNATIDGKRLAEHILATVREDDGEPVTKSWVEDRTSFEFVEMDDGIWCILTDSYLPIDMTRGQFRALCEGLGIELGEKS